LAANVADWFRPIKKNEKTEMDGRPPTSPPIALPVLSATTVTAVTQIPPIAKARIKCTRRR